MSPGLIAAHWSQAEEAEDEAAAEQGALRAELDALQAAAADVEVRVGMGLWTREGGQRQVAWMYNLPALL